MEQFNKEFNALNKEIGKLRKVGGKRLALEIVCLAEVTLLVLLSLEASSEYVKQLLV